MVKYDVSEALEFARRIEENGEKFYRRMALLFDEPELKDLFTFLADEEIKHKYTYSRMLAAVKKNGPAGNYNAEYFANLYSFVDNVVFNEKKLISEMENINNPLDALDVALRFELENMLYFQELKNLVDKDSQDKIDQIIEQERGHFLKLSKLKNKKFSKGE